MLKTLQNAWKVSDLRRKILITLGLLAVYRAGIFIPVPGVNVAAVAKLVDSGSMAFGFLDLVSGGALKQFSIFAMGIMPYIDSSIIMSLLVIAIPSLEALSKEGEEGRKKIAEYTRYGTIFFAIIMGFSTSMALRNQGAFMVNSWGSVALVILTLTAGTTFIMWLGEKITEHGLGNGASLIIFAGIVTRMPSYGGAMATLVKAGSTSIYAVILYVAFLIAIVCGVVMMDLGERRIPVQYAQRRVGMRSYGGQSTHIPINVNQAGVVAIIFAMSVMQFPQVITQFLGPTNYFYQLFSSGILGHNSPIYYIINMLLVVFFTWFYTSVTFKPEEVAENLQKSGGFVPGLRPGKPTESYITTIMNRMTIIGGTFAAFVAVIPAIIGGFSNLGSTVYFGGTSILIMVGVALEMNKQLRAQLVMRHYEGFLK
jgi:preprotein translocase subunit SecY